MCIYIFIIRYNKKIDGKGKLLKYEDIYVHHPIPVYPDTSLEFGGFIFKLY